VILRGLSLAVATLFAAPLAYLAVRNAAHLDAFVDAVSSRRALEALARTLLLAGTVSAATAVLGTGAAWLVVRTDVPARRLWRVLLPLPLVIPSFIGAFALVAAFSPGGLLDVLGTGRVEGFLAAFAVLTLLSYPYVYLPVAARLGRLPGSVEESARLLGRRGPATFVSIVLPQLRGAIAAGALLVFLYVVSDFGAVQLLRYDTLTRTIYATRVFDRETSLALCLELGLLALLVVALERAFAPGRHVEASRGRPLALRLGRWRLPALGGLALLVGLALAAPVAVLCDWAWRGLTSGSERPGAIASDLSRVVEPALNTAGVSIAAALAAVAVVLPVAVLSVRRRGPVPSLASAVIVGGFALPGLATALALVYWTLAAPWPVGAAYQTVGLLVFAYVVHFGAQSLRTAEVAVGGVPSQLEDAARGLGARRARRWLRVELPLMAPGLAAGGGLVLLSAMKELPATLLLAPPGFQTLATTIWTSTEDAFLADASIAALALIALSGVLTWVLLVRRPLE
jgi:iron(III) transport system permease protein